MAKRKKKNDALESIKPAFQVGGISIGSLLVGSALQSKLPAGVVNPLTQIGVVGTKIVSPLVIIGGTSLALKELKKIEKLKGG